MRARVQLAGVRFPRLPIVLILLTLVPLFRPTVAGALTFGGWGGRLVPTPGSETRNGSTVKRYGHVIGGGSLTHYPKDRFGFEMAAGFSRAPSVLWESGQTHNADLDAIYGSLAFLVRLNAPEAPLLLLARTGPAWVHHSAPRDIVHGRSDYGATLGVAARRHLTGILSARADGEDFIYRADYGVGRRMRNDFIFRLGLELAKQKK